MMRVPFMRLFQVVFNLLPRREYFCPILGRGLFHFFDSLRNATQDNHTFLMSAQRVVDLSKYTTQWISCYTP